MKIMARKSAGVCLLIVILLAVPLVSLTEASATQPSDWSVYLHGPGHDSFNAAATSITPAKISNVEPIWKWKVPKSPNTGTTSLLASPTVVDGVVYIGAKDGMFFAIDEATRSILWSRFLGIDTPKGTCGTDTQGIVSTADAVVDPQTGLLTLYVNSPDGYLYALDAASGNIVWRSVVDVPSSTVNDYYSWGTPLVANGNVYIGISSDCDSPLVPAGLLAFDQSTGSPLAEWHSLPPGKLGASIWSSPVALADGSVIATTGNTLGTIQPLYADSIVRLDGNNLGLLDFWQLPPSQQVRDADFGASPTLFTADLGGVSTPMVGACNKNGFYYAFRQDDLASGPVWQQRITRAYVGGAPQCDAAAIWDGNELIEGGGDNTVINGTTYPGSVRALDPSTGVPLWQTGLPGTILGSPTEDGAGVVAAQTYSSPTGKLGVFLLSAADGSILRYIATPKAPLYAQPVFAGSDLLVAGPPAVGLMAYEVTTPGPPITAVSPATLSRNSTNTFTLTGSGFSGKPTVFVSGTLVTTRSVTVVSSTTLKVKLNATAGATVGPRDIVVIEPGPTADTCTACLTIV
jgi:polyvinyl alcohol dehydrogenase (cytochrome)